jgi:hypothetical protein
MHISQLLYHLWQHTVTKYSPKTPWHLYYNNERIWLTWWHHFLQQTYTMNDTLARHSYYCWKDAWALLHDMDCHLIVHPPTMRTVLFSDLGQEITNIKPLDFDPPLVEPSILNQWPRCKPTSATSTWLKHNALNTSTGVNPSLQPLLHSQ